MTNVFETLLLIALMVAGLLLGYIDHRLLPKQIPDYPNLTDWFPGIYNLTWFANLCILPFGFYVMQTYDEWPLWPDKSVAFCVSAAVTILMFWFVYRRGPLKDMFVGHGSIRPAGVLLMIYSTFFLTTFLLWLFRSSVEATDVAIVWIVIALYLPVVNHMVIHVLNNFFYFDGCPQVFTDETRPRILLRNGEIGVAMVMALKLIWPYIR